MTAHPKMHARDVQWLVAWLILIVGWVFWSVEAVFGHTMPEGIYGYAIYDVDASTWAWAVISAGMLVILGIHINGRWRWSPLLRLIGYAQHIGIFAFFAWSGLGAAEGVPLAIWAGCFMVPLHLVFVFWNARDLYRRRAGGGN